MILQALTAYYEALVKKGGIVRPGWGNAKISYALELDENGGLIRTTPLSSPSADGKKPLPRQMDLPAAVKRTMGISPNFLWDNSSYLLGFDAKGKPDRARECFAAARKLHLALLGDLDDPFARAVCRFFERWNPDTAAANPVFADCLEEIQKGANLVFRFGGEFAGDDDVLRRVWQAHYDGGTKNADGETMRCLVTGGKVVPEKIHPPIKNVAGAQPSGAALVSFNAEAFCSYGREQNLNAPVGKYAAFAYAAALNALLADRDHVWRCGDTTVVFWAEDAEPAYQDVFTSFANGGGDRITDSELKSCVSALLRGEIPAWKGAELHPDNPFFILGLAPNAARISVRFFLRGTFGRFLENVQRHYDNIRIVGDNRSKGDIPLWALLRETVNLNSKNKGASPQMAGDTVRAVLTGQRYPATLYQQTQLRIRAERNVTRGRAEIIKGYLIRMNHNEDYKEALTVELNENTRYQPYVLGRLFSVLEGLQQAANPGINTTIKDRYFTSAGATPGIVFPTLLNLAEKHLRKLDGGLRVHYARQITELTGYLTEDYPAHHNLYDQGIFQLGYYHQTQKRFEKKDKQKSAETIKEEKENG